MERDRNSTKWKEVFRLPVFYGQEMTEKSAELQTQAPFSCKQERMSWRAGQEPKYVTQSLREQTLRD